MNRKHRLCFVTAVVLTLGVGITSPAEAAAPSNDGAGKAKAATGIGYSDSVNVSQATAGPNDPITCSNNASVWYRYTPTAAETINVNTSGSNYDTVIGVYTGRPGSFSRVACRDDSFTTQAALDVEVQAGRTYWFMVGACCGNGRDGQDIRQQPARLQFHLMAPLRVEQLAVAETGSVDRADGDAHVTVTRQCNRAANRGFLEGTLQQRVGDTFLARGFGFARAACGTSPTESTLTLPPEVVVAFAEGPATVSLRLTACSTETGTCARRRVTQDVALAFPQP